MVRVKDIPVATRWLMATYVLTRLVVVLGQKQEKTSDVNAFREKMYSEMTRRIHAIADQYRMPKGNAADLVQTLGTISVVLFGPKFETRYIEGFPEEAVIRLAECAMFGEDLAAGVSPAKVHSVCDGYVRRTIEALNPEFTISVDRARCCGDSFCEMVIGRKKK